jgi:hypothetical protein
MVGVAWLLLIPFCFHPQKARADVLSCAGVVHPNLVEQLLESLSKDQLTESEKRKRVSEVMSRDSLTLAEDLDRMSLQNLPSAYARISSIIPDRTTPENLSIYNYLRLTDRIPSSERLRFFRSWLQSEEVNDYLLSAILTLDIQGTLRRTEQDLREFPSRYGLEFIWQRELAGEKITNKGSTSYRDALETILTMNPKPGQTITDLGGGFNPLGFVIGAHFPNLNYFSIELVRERVEESQRAHRLFNFPENIRFAQGDLRTYPIPESDIYYAYYPVSPSTAKIVMEKLELISRKRKFRMFIRLGFGDLNMNRVPPWLQLVKVHHGSFILETKP